MGMQKDGYDKGEHQLHLQSKRLVVMSPNWLQFFRAPVVERTTGLELSSETMSLRYLKLITFLTTNFLNFENKLIVKRVGD